MRQGLVGDAPGRAHLRLRQARRHRASHGRGARVPLLAPGLQGAGAMAGCGDDAPADTPEGAHAFLCARAKVSSELWPAVPPHNHKAMGMDDPWCAMAKVDDSLCAMAKAAVDRSGGRLQKFVARNFTTEELLEYIADRSPSLKSLGLMQCHDISEKGFMDLIVKFPQLE